MTACRRPFLLAMVLLAAAGSLVAQTTSVNPGINDSYVDPDPDAWSLRLEAEDRAIYKFRHAIVATLSLAAGTDVADVGAGTGFLTRLMARQVGDGRVYAVDIAQSFLDHIAASAQAEEIDNIVPVLAAADDARLPSDSVDLVLICDTYHHFEFPQKTLASIHRALRPGGRMVVIDFERVVGVSPDFALSHVRAGKGTVTDEIKDAGFDLVREIPLMEAEGQWVREFVKR